VANLGGRKSLKDELKMFDRYSELTVPYFRVLKKHLESNNVTNEKWAVEQLTKAFTKMIPTELTGADGKDLIPSPILGLMNVQTDNGDNQDIQSEEAPQSDTGRDISIEDNIDTPAIDTGSSDGQEADTDINS